MMCHNYVSTRGGEKKVCFTEAILNPAAENGGLYSPTNIFRFNLDKLEKLSYTDLAFLILQAFYVDLDNQQISRVLDEAYKNFDDPNNPAPVRILNENLAVCELFHGPTRAFKDMALQPFMRLFSTIANQKDQEYLILTATSGDTGPAVLSAAADRSNIKVFCMYPNNGTSEVQELQMLTQNESNLKVVAIEGNFDDAQTKLKSLMRDENMQRELLIKKKIKFSAANSVNFARIAFQVVYQFWSYFQLVKQKNKFDLKNTYYLVIPSGNFGNALAAYYAKKMGLPIEKIVIATNDNDILSRFINTGVYDLTDRKLVKTNSPAMDILKSSNIERLLFDLFGSQRTKELMESLEKNKVFFLEDKELAEVKKHFLAGTAYQKEVTDAINWLYYQNNYIVDPHTANAFIVYDKLELYDKPVLIHSTAEWTKFASVIADAFDIDISELSGLDVLEKISEELNLYISPKIKKIFEKKEVKKEVVSDTNKIDYKILEFVGII